jgi:hypothetical protein
MNFVLLSHRFCVLIIRLLSLGVFFSCQYRFTNLNSPNLGYHTIGVEAVYDTSQKRVPHEFLWNSLERALARNGRLLVTGVAESELYMRVHLKTASTTSFDLFIPKAPSKASSVDTYPRKEKYTLGFQVEVWDQADRRLVFQKSYVLPFLYDIYRPLSPLGTEILRIQEARESQMVASLDELSDQVTRDLLGRL